LGWRAKGRPPPGAAAGRVRERNGRYDQDPRERKVFGRTVACHAWSPREEYLQGRRRAPRLPFDKGRHNRPPAFFGGPRPGNEAGGELIAVRANADDRAGCRDKKAETPDAKRETAADA
jgi:hypothetical protein